MSIDTLEMKSKGKIVEEDGIELTVEVSDSDSSERSNNDELSKILFCMLSSENGSQLKEKMVFQSGGKQKVVSALEYLKLIDAADAYYEKIRNTKEDIEKIAMNVNMPNEKINRIKNHVFMNEHILDDGVGRFDADVEMAEAWKRLVDGNYSQNDLDLLEHEYFESIHEETYQTDYRTVHQATLDAGYKWDPSKEVD